MLRFFCLMVMMFVTALFAETQEEAYYRALKAEEAGDIPTALQAFEEAAAMPGPYTEELQGIIRDYKAALGTPTKNALDSASGKPVMSPWDFHVAGELGLYGMHYKETGMDEGEKGGDIFLNLNPYLDYEAGSWSHTFAFSAQGDYFLNNDEMSVLDTNDWNLTLGLEYTLMGHGLLLDLGYDFNIEGEQLSSDFFAWLEKDLFRFEKQRVGIVAWAYYQTSGPMSFAAYASWHRTVPSGLNGTVYVGAKFEADSVFDYKAFQKSYAEYRQAYKAYQQSVQEYLLDLDNPDLEDSVPEEPSSESIVFRQTLGKWFGPVFRSRIAYKFKNKITAEAKMNLFYGFAIDGPDGDYKRMRKFNGVGGITVSWKYWKISYYLGLDRNYKRYFLPRYYRGIYSESSTLTQLKLGIKWDL